MPKPITIKAWLDWAKTKIDPLDAEIIALRFFAPTGVDRSWLVTHQDRLAPVDFDSPLGDPANAMVEKRAKGEPMAYLLGRQDFYGREFSVTRDVLIPRPESEAIIDLAKALDLPADARIIDVGTGSGCLAITLSLELPEATVVGLDISPYALTIAGLNNRLLGGNVIFAHSDLLSSVNPEKHGSFDLIVANLPYVNPRWDWLNLKSLLREPHMALFPEHDSVDNGLSTYERFLAELSDYAKSAPIHNLILEADPCQHEHLIDFAKKYGWVHHTTSGYALAFKPTTK